MGQVTVTIAGKVFRMACDDGQESHLEKLAASVDNKINDLRAAFGEIGDQRLTVMAAIAIADEASEQLRRLTDIESEIEALKRARSEAQQENAASQQALAGTIVQLATRVERITDIVEGRVGEGD